MVRLDGLEPSLTDIICMTVLPHRIPTMRIRLSRKFLLLFQKRGYTKFPDTDTYKEYPVCCYTKDRLLAMGKHYHLIM
jgi:hypothetical protein